MKKTILTLCAGLFSLASIIPIHASAQTTANSQSAANDVPRVISYQAAITDASGNALPDGIYTIGAALYNVAGDRTIWRDTYHVEARNGVVNLLLGSGSVALPDFSQAGAVWLGIRINGNEELPLTQFTGAPYALTVPNGAITTPKIANNAVTAEKMGMDYVGSLSVNGQKVSGKGGDINIVTDGIDATVDPGSSSVILRNGSGSSATGTKGSGVQGNSTVTGTLTVTGSTLLNTSGGTTTISSLAASQPVKTDANKVLISGAMNLGSSNDVTGTLPIANGGTGATTSSGAVNALGAAPATRTISTGTGLSGGGDLSADRTISLDVTNANTWTGVQFLHSSAAQGNNLIEAINAADSRMIFSATHATQADAAGTIFNWSTGGASVITALSTNGGTLTNNTSGNAANVTGTVAVANGGTGATTAAAALSTLGATPATRTISSGTGLSGGGDLSADRTISLANTAVTAGSYSSANITVDAQGRLTAASSGVSGFTPSYFNAFTQSGGAYFVPANGGVPFFTLGLNSGFVRPPNSDGFTTTVAGVYNVEFTVTVSGTATFSITKNGWADLSSTMGVTTTTAGNSKVVHGNSIISLAAGDVIGVISQSGGTLAPVGFGSTIASLTAIRIQ